MELIELWNGDTKALISREGAWLTNLSDENGDVLYPKRTLTTADGSQKVRGGSHVCLPNFGPGGETGLTQHGFGRTALWEIVQQAESRVDLSLRGGVAGYEGLVSTLTYELAPTALDMTLEVANEGEGQLRIAPAFHPYFALQAGEGEVKIDADRLNLEDLSEMQLSEGEAKELHTAKRVITIGSKGLQTWALWTDQLGNYVCVEPTLGGYTFLEPTPRETELLQPGESRQYACRISWK